MAELPKFDAPPVTEAVISVQFESLPGLSAAHCGWYWQQHLGSDRWASVSEAATLDDVFEHFGDGPQWKTPGVQLSPAEPHIRLQFVSADDEHMIQIQRSRFAYNWRRRGGEYPTFDKLLPLFDEQFNQFEAFVQSALGAGIVPNQWEITYVNALPKGELWESPSDWGNIFPVLAPPVSPGRSVFESSRADWHFVLGGAAGRLHVEAKHGKERGQSQRELLIVQLTSRGPVGPGADFHDGLALGHEYLVRSFVEMASDSAQRTWKRSR